MFRSSASSRRPRLWALAAIVAVALHALPLAAGPPSEGGEEAEPPAAAEQQAEPAPGERAESPIRTGQGDAFWWLYVSGLGLAGLLSIGYYFYRRFQPEQGYDVEQEDAAFEGMAFEESTPEQARANQGQLSRAEQAFFSVPESSSGGPSAQMAFGQSTESERMCPECGEQFPASVVLCPYDSTPLQNIDEPRTGSSSDETVLERQRCPGCGRRYSPDPDYCYHDGMRLRQDTVEDADDAPEFKACETCGWEGETDERLCPKDGTELIVVAPGEDGRATPPLPVLVCPECGSFAEPGTARCPEDDAVLTPLRNAHARQLPERGYGPRRKICEECGETFSQAASYCTRDGSELVPMN